MASESLRKSYKDSKIYGTNAQISQVIDELELPDLECEELEDQMPKDFEEITEPYFNSFEMVKDKSSVNEVMGQF